MLYLLINWSVVAISVFNTIALLWLGLTVLLNAERPRWGTWVVGGGLILAGLFFAAHSAAIASDPWTIGREIRIWWRLIWLPCLGGPYLWYLAMAWYTNALNARHHRMLLIVVGAVGLLALILVLLVNPIPSYDQFREQPSPPIFSLAGIPAALLIYPVYSMLCIMLSLLALRHPVESDRFMGDLARIRARPWLIATSFILLMVGAFAGMVAAWFLIGSQLGRVSIFSNRTLVIFYIFDLIISALIAVGVVLMGKAIVAYEIFTGKALPRGGLARYWRRSLILAAGYGSVLAWSLTLSIDSIYRLMLATVMMTLFFALLSWRSFAERNRSIEQLRPFVTSQHLYEGLIDANEKQSDSSHSPINAGLLLAELSESLLGARLAYLVPSGALAPLVRPLAVGEGRLHKLTADMQASLQKLPYSTQQLCLALNPQDYGGAVWAIPLWSARGLIGALLLGEKRDGSLYTQEEIEIARTTAERLVDTRASSELAQRLMQLQRQRLTENQVIDRRARRTLHDEVLPQIHTAMLLLGAEENKATALSASSPASLPAVGTEVIALLSEVHHQISDLLHDMPATVGKDVARIGLHGALRNTVHGEFGEAFDNIEWQISAEAEQYVQHMPALNAEVLFYAAREVIRNAARYGRGSDARRPLKLCIMAHCLAPSNELSMTISDNGVGIQILPQHQQGGGHGLILHSTMLAVIGGTLFTHSKPGSGTSVTLRLTS